MIIARWALKVNVILGRGQRSKQNVCVCFIVIHSYDDINIINTTIMYFLLRYTVFITIYIG